MQEVISNEERLIKIATLLEELVCHTEESINKGIEMLGLLVKSIADTQNQRESLEKNYEKRLSELRSDRISTIQRLEKRLETAEKRYDEEYKQCHTLIAIVEEKDKQIESLEDRLMLRRDNVTIGGITNQA